MTNNDNVTGIRSAAGDAQETIAGLEQVHIQGMRAREEGRYDDALRHVQAAFARAVTGNSDGRVGMFVPMLEWELLAECHPPAREALAQARDAQVHLLLAGDASYGVAYSEYLPPPSRFQLIARMNETLGDASSTYEVFVQLAALMPEHAGRKSFLALPAIVDAGDFALAERYMPDPLGSLRVVNETARNYPLFPPGQTAPRLLGEMMNFARDLRLAAAILRGLGRGVEAQALLDSALAGLASDQLRTWTQRDLEAPGTILRASVEHRMAFDEGRDSPYLNDEP